MLQAGEALGASSMLPRTTPLFASIHSPARRTTPFEALDASPHPPPFGAAVSEEGGGAAGGGGGGRRASEVVSPPAPKTSNPKP